MSTRLSTGIEGLDDVLGGGLPGGRVYLLQGEPGSGKTTLAMQFLLAGVARRERCLYVSLSETREELLASASAHGWSLDGIDIHELANASSSRDEVEAEDNTLYAVSEVELGERMQELLDVVERLRPTRIVLDSCTELRLLAQTPLRFRRQILALKHDLVRRQCTIMLIENPLTVGGDPLLQSLVHGVIVLEQLSPLYGAERRRLRIAKLREVKFRGGYHDLTIRDDGLHVFPRLVASEHHERFASEQVPSGVAGVDQMLGGGLDRGTATLFIGPAGSGKSAIVTQYVVAAAARGERSAVFAFDEGARTMLERAAGLGQDLGGAVERGLVHLQQVDPAELSPGEFVAAVRAAVVAGARVVVIDSLNGYLQSMPEEEFLTAQLHELLAFLRQQGVVTILVLAQSGLVGTMKSPIDVSYLADAVVLTRYFEIGGRVRKAISVFKRRSGRHEDAIRELTLGPRGIEVSEPLTGLQGVLTGIPRLTGSVAGEGDPA